MKRLESYQESSVLDYQLLISGLQVMRFIQCEEDKACQSPNRDSPLFYSHGCLQLSHCLVAVAAATCVLATALCSLVFHKWEQLGESQPVLREEPEKAWLTLAALLLPMPASTRVMSVHSKIQNRSLF